MSAFRWLSARQCLHFDNVCISTMSAFRQCLHFDGLVQDCSNSSANALELLQSCTKPSICSVDGVVTQFSDSYVTRLQWVMMHIILIFVWEIWRYLLAIPACNNNMVSTYCCLWYFVLFLDCLASGSLSNFFFIKGLIVDITLFVGGPMVTKFYFWAIEHHHFANFVWMPKTFFFKNFCWRLM